MMTQRNIVFKNTLLAILIGGIYNSGNPLWAAEIKISSKATGATPGSYTFLSWPASTQNRLSEDYTITVNNNPGPNSNVFWSNQFSIGNYGGYTGMQSTYLTHGTLTGKQFLFSVWDATASKTGSPGSWCVSNTDGSPGQGCRYAYDWQEQHTYKFHLAAEGGNWYGVTVSDVTDNPNAPALFKIGSVFLPGTSNTVMPGLWVQFTEYFEWNNSRTTCGTAPYSSATFSATSTQNNMMISAIVQNTKTSTTCQTFTKLTSQPNSSLSTHINGVGNSRRVQITNSGLCLNAAGGLSEGTSMILWPCGTNPNIAANETWVYSSDGSIRATSDYCVTAPSGTNTQVTVQTCMSGALNQQWVIADGQIISASNPGTYLIVNSNNQVVTSKVPTLKFWHVPTPNV